MAKIEKVLKIEIEAGKATPAPPVGTILGPLGINLQEFCTKYNDMTKDKMGSIIPVEITIYEDRTFSLVPKTPPTASLLLKAAGKEKGSVKGANELVATITPQQVKEIAEIKLPDLNAYDLDAAINIVAGTARNMGIAVKGINDQELAEQAEEALKAEAEMAKLDAELEAMEQEAKAMADEAMPEVESSEQALEDESEDSENEEKSE